MIDPKEIQKTLNETFQDSRVEVRDLTGTGDHFEALVVTSDFEGMNRVEQHQAIYKALNQAKFESLHAIALKTFTPDEYQKELAENKPQEVNGNESEPLLRLPIVKGP